MVLNGGSINQFPIFKITKLEMWNYFIKSISDKNFGEVWLKYD